MDRLTEEQRKRMEENRQKALAKRAAAMASKNSAIGSISCATSNAEKTPVPPFSALSVSGPGKSNPQIFTNQKHNFYKPSASGLPASNSAPISGNPVNKTAIGVPSGNYSVQQKQQSDSTKNPYPSSWKALVTGGCAMISRDRFVVNVNYHPQVIDVFKSIESSMYDPETKKWSFPLSQHGNLMTALNPLKSVAAIGPLPSFVLKIFRNLDPTKRKCEVDPNMLSRIDQQLVSTLFDYQKEGICFGIRNNGRCFIADDMGLGKTLQALGIAYYYYDEWPLLIATASSMRFAWKEAIWKWLPQVPAGAITVAESSKEFIQFAKVVILSYDLLQRRVKELSAFNFNVVIMDESHNLKSWKTARSKAALPMVEKANRAILLSGTPALSRPIELFSQVSSINRKCFPTWEEYGMRYCNGKKTNWGWDFNGSCNMEELNLVLRETVMIRRMKSDVLTQLPPKRRKTIPLDLGGASDKAKGLKMTQAAFVKTKKSNVSEYRGKLLQYFVETAKVKVSAVVNYVQELIDQDKKFLLFAHHREMLDGVSRALDSLKVKYIRIDGTTSSEERHFLCEQFQFHDDIKVAVLSILAANSGITLTAAHLVVFAELFWNPGILTQAEDRVHRFGQQDSVLIEYLVASGTADDYLWRIVADKLDTLNKAGLSKDNFHEASVQILKPKHQKEINEFFLPLESIPSSEELEAIFSVDFDEDDLAESNQPNPSTPPKKIKL